jgi:hypothetical protein
MNALIRFVLHITFIAVCGLGVVMLETPPNLLVYGCWAMIVGGGALRSGSWGGFRRALVVAAIHVGAMGVIITAAIAAPVKRTDTVLQQPVELSTTEMTVAELSEYCRFHREQFPLRISIPAGGTALDKRLRFPAVRMSLQQFITELEQQTGCRHRFFGCGNAYSVLYGPAYNIGLHFMPPSEGESL